MDDFSVLVPADQVHISFFARRKNEWDRGDGFKASYLGVNEKPTGIFVSITWSRKIVLISSLELWIARSDHVVELPTSLSVLGRSYPVRENMPRISNRLSGVCLATNILLAIVCQGHCTPQPCAGQRERKSAGAKTFKIYHDCRDVACS